jgi:hypothetical protein
LLHLEEKNPCGQASEACSMLPHLLHLDEKNPCGQSLELCSLLPQWVQDDANRLIRSGRILLDKNY